MLPSVSGISSQISTRHKSRSTAFNTLDRFSSSSAHCPTSCHTTALLLDTQTILLNLHPTLFHNMADTADPILFVPPPQVPNPPIRTIASADPEDPYQLQTQLDMEDALMCDGWAGLCQVIYSIALSEKDRASEEFKPSWDKLLSDATSGNNYVYHLLR